MLFNKVLSLVIIDHFPKTFILDFFVFLQNSFIIIEQHNNLIFLTGRENYFDFFI